MSSLKEIEEKINYSHSVLVNRFKVKEMGIFGSFIRDQQSEESDIDILVEFYEPVGWEFIDLKDYLEELLGRKVDLVTKNALKPRIRDKILKEVIYTR